jgi:hypothetical protein
MSYYDSKRSPVFKSAVPPQRRTSVPPMTELAVVLVASGALSYAPHCFCSDIEQPA